MASVPLNILLVITYHHVLCRFGYLRLLQIALFSSSLLYGVGSFYALQIPGLAFGLYIWKDLFIMLLFNHLWSLINSTVAFKNAKYLYGMIFGFGALGSVVSSLVPGFLAHIFGSGPLLLFTLPLFGAVYYASYQAYHERSKIDGIKELGFGRKDELDPQTGLHHLRDSKYIQSILAIVLAMQIAATLLDYQFNIELVKHVGEVNARTEFLGRLYAIVNSTSGLFQVFLSYALIHFAGVSRTLTLIPIYLALSVVGYMGHPTFTLILITFSAIKVFDFSIFNIAKEMLYLPLSIEVKFKTKPIIDIFVCRSAKAGASLLIIAFTWIFPMAVLQVISWILIVILLLWAFISWKLNAFEETQSLK
ncbi:MAG: hypothetical protein S4CHLAM102_13030 [Chlamydiia bacterium]|nr:hypothetical protein [Chlamydiia bacterium]